MRSRRRRRIVAEFHPRRHCPLHHLPVLPIPDGDEVRCIRCNQPWMSGMQLDLHDLVARRPKRSQPKHLGAGVRSWRELSRAIKELSPISSTGRTIAKETEISKKLQIRQEVQINCCFGSADPRELHQQRALHMGEIGRLPLLRRFSGCPPRSANCCWVIESSQAGRGRSARIYHVGRVISYPPAFHLFCKYFLPLLR